MMEMRIGQGIDIHRFGEGSGFYLGGVFITHHQGVVAHSDGDVLVHALCDALLGALGLGDIGHHFPDTDERFRGASGQFLLSEVMRLVRDRGYRPVNIDLTVLLERPKIAGYLPMMREQLATWLEISVDRVSVKATTSERLGYIGRGEGIEVHCVALLTSGIC
jgi:2-C-methyl-D-erythritol 2,4-cyclodiphosphate synthase